jgi:hypothetical protein
MAYTKDTVSKFTRITGFDFSKYLSDIVAFNGTQKQKIYDYYEGLIKPDGEAFSKLDDLLEESKRSISLLEINNGSLSMYDDWELFSELELIAEKLKTVFNSSKYLRSAITTGNFNANPLIEQTLNANTTLERFTRNLNSNDHQNDWSEVFLNNQLTEEDYTSQGGNLLKVTLQGADGLFIQSVVDNIDSGEKTYGKDIQAKIEFLNDDLKVLSYRDTLLQSATINSSLLKGHNPEFLDQGIDKSIAVGETISSVSFPVIFRQMYQNFATDDSFKSFSVTDIKFNADALEIYYQVTTRDNEIQEGFLTI